MNILQSALEQVSFFTIPQVTVKDMLDILIVTVGIYKIIIWIKDTRTWALFKGIIMILTAAILSYLLELHTISFIVSNTLTAGTIAVLILFQPELRRALEQLGQGNLWGSTGGGVLNDKDMQELSDSSVLSIVKATRIMSNVKTGALIVIEGTTLLEEYKRTGIPINAVITQQLLVNIFEKNTPLHDGAVIISKNRIHSATCFLPLSSNLNISKELGTRHRAAIGVTEETDAVVVVVSEETGAISYVRNGRIKRDIDSESLEKLLTTSKRTRSKTLTFWRKSR
ncbi:MAG: TIGR00159 family protein [Epulopiscium sp. Nuni2H_MBin003]|nr:MAG: TIGR00159 family protein [Epulopiscium sp. Nuni2H_MBin003]